MKKNLLTLGVILMSALTFTACSDDNDFTHSQQYLTQMYMLLVLVTGMQMMVQWVFSTITASHAQLHHTSTVMLIELRMVTESVTHKT